MIRTTDFTVYGCNAAEIERAVKLQIQTFLGDGFEATVVIARSRPFSTVLTGEVTIWEADVTVEYRFKSDR